MRVISGSAKSLKLKTIEGPKTRPTTDRIKETLFNMIQNDLFKANVLDLFAGSGAIGIEALSRGAAFAVFVEKNRNAIQCIEENLKHTNLFERAEILSMECMSAIRHMEGREPFDLIFMDPPYDHMLEKDALTFLADSPIVSKETLMIIEASINTEFSYLSEIGFSMIREKKYKTNKHVFIKRFA